MSGWEDSLASQVLSFLLVNGLVILGIGHALGWWTVAWIIVGVNVILFLLHLGWRANH